MIVGNGMIANSLKNFDREDTIYFCSGVSNSSELDAKEYKREKDLLLRFSNTDKRLIYFSSYFVNFEDYLTNKYYQHKSEMEFLVKTSSRSYTIYRLPQVVGKSKNPNTLTNFLANKIFNNTLLYIYKDVKRNLIDVDDVVRVIDYVNKKNLFLNKTVNLISPKNYDIIQIVTALEKEIGVCVKKEYHSSKENEFLLLLNNEVVNIYKKLDIEFNEFYLEKLVHKYYKRRNFD